MYRPTDVILVRHGEPDAPHGTFLGHTDPALVPEGHAQAAVLAATLPAYVADIAACYVSPLRRAVETAQPLVAAYGVPMQLDARLQELAFGAWEGASHASLGPSSAEAIQAWFADPVHIKPGATGESFLDVRARLEDWLSDLPDHGNGPIMVVAHFGSLANLAAVLMDMPASYASQLRLSRGQAGRIKNGVLQFWGVPVMPPVDRRHFGHSQA